MAIKDYINVNTFIDDKAFFNNDINKWVLKLDYANHRSGLDLVELWRSEENAEWYLEMVATVVYATIMEYKKLEEVKNFEYLLNHSKDLRNSLTEIMIDAVVYNEAGGGFLIAYETGINLQEMKELKMDIGQAMSSIAKSMVEKSGLGIRALGVDISFVKGFDDIETLLDYLISKNLLEANIADEIEDIKEIPFDYRYKCFYDDNYKKFYYKRTGGENIWQETETL